MRRPELTAGSAFGACLGQRGGWNTSQCQPECDHTLVYFIQEDGGVAIKIGHGEWPERRLAACQNGNPRELRLLAWMRGGKRLESELHVRFARSAIRGEWFRATDDILAFIRDHATAFRRPVAPRSAHA